MGPPLADCLSMGYIDCSEGAGKAPCSECTEDCVDGCMFMGECTAYGLENGPTPELCVQAGGGDCRATSGECKAYCANHVKGWGTKCTFNDCSACEEYAEVDTSCPDWCGAHTAPWARKCKMSGCENCSTCSTISGECKNWCSGNAQQWGTKCTWTNCDGCDECQ